MAVSPDGSRLVTGSSDATVRIWDAAAGKQLMVLEGDGGAIHALALSPDGSKIVTGSISQTTLWGCSNAEMYRARLKTAAIERRLEERVALWLSDGPDAALNKLNESKAVLTTDEYRVGGNMILSNAAAKAPRSGE